MHRCTRLGLDARTKKKPSLYLVSGERNKPARHEEHSSGRVNTSPHVGSTPPRYPLLLSRFAHLHWLGLHKVLNRRLFLLACVSRASGSARPLCSFARSGKTCHGSVKTAHTLVWRNGKQPVHASGSMHESSPHMCACRRFGRHLVQPSVPRSE